MQLAPRVVIAGTHSGVGKTTIASGLMAAFARRGLRVASAKVGPDFIDPGYHALATARPGRNLDAWMSGLDAIGPLAGRAGRGADLLVIEGVMGMFDGAVDGAPSSTADIARELDAPVILAIDASGMSHSVAAVVHGFSSFDPQIAVAGVICNRVGSERHLALLRAALDAIRVPLLGALRRDAAFEWRDRHLGLVPVVEHPERVRVALGRLAEAIEEGCDLDAIQRIAGAAPRRSVAEPALPNAVGSIRLAVASGPAFSFCYQDNLEAFAAAGAELVPFDPCAERALPEHCDALVAGGGFPEVYGAALSDNTALLQDVKRATEHGLVVWAECGGLLWLAQQLDGRAMANVVPTVGQMTDRLTLGYRHVRTEAASPLGAPGLELRGHEFHYSTVSPAGTAFTSIPTGTPPPSAWLSPRTIATYLHTHLGAAPQLAESFVRAAASR